MLFLPKRELTLGSFVPAPRNARARAACINFILSESPAPAAVLLVAGQENTGKTHLLHAATHLANTTEHLRHCCIVSHRRLADELERAAIVYQNLPEVIDRFSHVDLLVIDDADELLHRSQVAEALQRILVRRSSLDKRTLLSVTLDASTAPLTPLCEFLNQQWAVRLR